MNPSDRTTNEEPGCDRDVMTQSVSFCVIKLGRKFKVPVLQMQCETAAMLFYHVFLIRHLPGPWIFSKARVSLSTRKKNYDERFSLAQKKTYTS